MSNKKYPQFTLRLDKETLDSLDLIATAQGRTVSNVIKLALARFLEENPITPQHPVNVVSEV